MFKWTGSCSGEKKKEFAVPRWHLHVIAKVTFCLSLFGSVQSQCSELGAREMFTTTTTKQINVYGKRSRRVVQVSDENRGLGTSREPETAAGKTPRRVSKPHIARTSTSPLNISKHTSNNTLLNPRKLHLNPTPKRSISARRVVSGRKPFTDVMNSPMAKRATSDYFSKQRPNPRKPQIEVITIEDSEEGSGSESDVEVMPPTRTTHPRRNNRVVYSDEGSEEDEEDTYIPTPRIRNARRRIVTNPEEDELPINDAPPVIDLTAEHSASPNTPLNPTQSSQPKVSRPTHVFSSSGNLFKQPGSSLHVPKKRLPSNVPPTSRKVSKTQALMKPFEDLTLDDTSPKPTKRFVSTSGYDNFSPLKTRTQRKASHPVKASPLRDSVLSPPRNHRARVISKNHKDSPVRASLLPAEDEKKTEAQIVEVKPAPAPRSIAPSSRCTTTFEELLKPLLAECGQQEVIDFDFFISTFPSDEMFDDSPPPVSIHSKIGEATYSEVFGCGNVVLKIVPLRNPETASREEEVAEEELPTQSEIAEVEREIITTRALGEFSKGFVKLLR